MALHTNSSNNTQPQGQPMPNQQSQGQPMPNQQPQQPQQPQGQPMPNQQPQQPQGQPQGRNSAVKSINSDMRHGMSRNRASIDTLEFMSVITERFDSREVSLNHQMDVTLVDNNLANTPLSMVIISTSAITTTGAITVPYFVFIMESSDAKYDRGNRHITMPIGNNMQVKTLLTATDYFLKSTDMNEVVRSHLAHYYGEANANYVKVGHMVVPNEIKPSEDKPLISKMTFSATTAIENHVSVEQGNDPAFSIGYVRSTNNNLHARIDVTPKGQTYTMTGQPVRTPIAITLRGEPTTNKMTHGQGLPDMLNSEPLTFLGGYMDLVFDKTQSQFQQPQFPNQMNPQSKVTYLPRFVITRLDTEIDAITMELQLLGLVTSLMLIDSSTGGAYWMEAFRPNPEAGRDFHDIGAVGYEVDLMDDSQPRPVDTKSSDFQTREFALEQLIHRVMLPNPIISMDVELGGDLSWINRLFQQAADPNNPNSEQARQHIIDSANVLTNDKFRETGYNGYVCSSDHNQIHIGHYRDADNNLRDIRDVDYLAMLNILGEDGNLDPLVKFSESYENNTPMLYRLHQRFEEITKVLGYEPRVKDWAQRINFDPNFLSSLLSACQAAGLTIYNENTRLVSGTPRGQHNLANYAVGAINSNVFDSTFNNPWGNGGNQFNGMVYYN